MVTLRMFTQSDLGYFDHLPGAEEDPFSFYGFRESGGRIRAQFAENQLVGEAGGTLAVVVGGSVVGDVQWHVVPYGLAPMSNSFNIGIRVLPAHQGQGHGTAAQRAIADYLFATYLVNRVEACTDVDNAAEQRALEKAGFTREGVLRGAQWRAGAWHDLVVFSRVRSDQPG